MAAATMPALPIGGVPVMRPLSLIVRPKGSVGMYASARPSGSLATICSETGCPSEEVWFPGLTIVGGRSGSTVHVNARLETARPSVADAVTGYVPTVVGFPLIRPVDAFTHKPGGRPVAEKLNVLPSGSEAVSCSTALLITLVA